MAMLYAHYLWLYTFQEIFVFHDVLIVPVISHTWDKGMNIPDGVCSPFGLATPPGIQPNQTPQGNLVKQIRLSKTQAIVQRYSGHFFTREAPPVRKYLGKKKRKVCCCRSCVMSMLLSALLYVDFVSSA